MSGSKALKKSFLGNKDKDPKTSLGKALKYLADKFNEYIYYPLDSFYNTYTERIGRSFAFAKIGWLNYDFDSGSIWPLLEFKLKRIKRALEKGCAIQEDEHMAALKEAIVICGRLHKEEYPDKYMRLHDKKWGKMKSKWIPAQLDKNGKPLAYTWETSRPKAKTKKQKEKEIAEFRASFAQAEKDQDADFERFVDILRKYMGTWWD